MSASLSNTEGRLVGTLQSDGNLKGSVSIPEFVPVYSGEEYKGPYVIKPKFTSQVMDTKEKHMTDDVTVESIPYSETRNTSGGRTINIGG